MRSIYLTTILLLSSYYTLSANFPANPYSSEFRQVYLAHPQLAPGTLEALAYINTRFENLLPETEAGCSGIPSSYGFFGLIADGKGHFRNTMTQVSELSEIDPIDFMPTVEGQANAVAISLLKNQRGKDRSQAILFALASLSEIPSEGNEFAFQSRLYALLTFLNDPSAAAKYGFPVYHFKLEEIFGRNLEVLQAGRVIVAEGQVVTPEGKEFIAENSFKSASSDYGPAIWDPTSCNYSSRNGVAVSAVTIHTVQGSYAGCISWFKNCSASASAHYVIRSSDGQVTQMVSESQKAWHVGSENPYTIGIEHEGYVSNASWYTTAMYNSSAALVRDICNSGYGINPLRTYFGASSSGINVLGSCRKIKGHQHYPNQTHTDPGINWDWERFYKLINNNPSITTLSAAGGNFYDSGGQTSDYSNDERILTLIQPVGATSVTLSFSSFNLENNWDYLFIYDGPSSSSPLIGTYTGTNNPGTITSTGGSLLIEFRSDCATTSPGWVSSWTSNATPPPPTDNVPPTTQVAVPSSWVTQNFTATFTDSDNPGGSGLQKSYYQVIDFDGSDWRANESRGFFSDNFDQAAIHPDWIQASGTWQLSGGFLHQSDQTNTNSNIYAPLTQNLSNRYLYHWAGRMEGTGTNRRAGLHFFCDQPALPNRGNSYFVWFRLDNQKVQIYEVVNDSWGAGPAVDVSWPFNAAQWYDFKVIYDRISGAISVYVDNVLAATWTDPTPLSNGTHISFRNGDSDYKVNNLKVYRSRNPSVTVDLGTAGDIRFQNPDPVTPSGRVKSMVQDSAGNLSAISFQDVNVDWTAPSLVNTVHDGSGPDIQVTGSDTTLFSNWTSSTDPHSDVARYWVSAGSSPGDTDVIGWTDNWFYTFINLTNQSLTNGQTYYFNVKAENGAGLQSAVVSSDGQTVQLVNPGVDEKNEEGFLIYPNPGNGWFTVKSPTQENGMYAVTDIQGKVISSGTFSGGRATLDLRREAAGVYFMLVQSAKGISVLQLIKE